MAHRPPLPDRVRLVVVFGGRSAEHDVSCVSAASVLAALDRGRYDVVALGITSEGRWVEADDAEAALGGEVMSLAASGAPTEPLAVLARPLAAGTPEAPTVVLPLVHGPLGEDGSLQGLLELAGVAYVGTGVLGSALCMDKAKAKEVLAQAGIAQARYLARRRPVAAEVVEQVSDHLGWPVFVKPANLGSSVGISRVAGPDEVEAAVELAASYDDWVVVEEAIVGREIECGVLGDDELSASVEGEIVPRGVFYDYEDKYGDGGADLVVPAQLSVEIAAEVRRTALAAAAALRVEGMARVDLFFEEAGRGLLVNEVNTIPGFTPRSMYPRLWAATGVPYPELVDRLVALALERHARRAGHFAPHG